jgi:hypothetical protein
VQRRGQDVFTIKTYKELMELFLRRRRNVIEVLGFEISIFWRKLVLESTLLLENLSQDTK